MQQSVGSETIFFKCYANLKCCSVKQLFNVSEEESSLNCAVTSSLHPVAAISLFPKYFFPLFALISKVTKAMCTAEISCCPGCVSSCHLSSLAASFQEGVSGEGETKASSQALCAVNSSAQRGEWRFLAGQFPVGWWVTLGISPSWPGKEGHRAGPEGPGGSKGVRFSSRDYFVALLMQVQIDQGRKCRPQSCPWPISV